MKTFLLLALAPLFGLSLTAKEKGDGSVKLVNIAPLSKIEASSQLGSFKTSFLTDGKRGLQSAGDYWNSGVKGEASTLRLVLPQACEIGEIRLHAPLMDKGAIHKIAVDSIELELAGAKEEILKGGTLLCGPKPGVSKDVCVKLSPAKKADAVTVKFGKGNADGWSFCGEIDAMALPAPGLTPPEEMKDGLPLAQEIIVPALSYEDSVKWLEENARTTIRAAARKTPSGQLAFPPQIGGGYEAFWLRDYAYMLETCADAFTNEELLANCRLFVNAIGKEDGAGVDCVKFSGEPIYKPGYGRMGSKPVADGSQFTVNVAWSSWKRSGDSALLAEVLDPLVKTMKAVPVNPETGLVRISSAEGEDRCPYGFTDTVAQRGDVLFCSLLYIQAAERLAEMLKAGGREAEAKDQLAAAEKARKSVNSVLWDEKEGLYLAATEKCRQPDLWGSVFAIWLGVAPKDRALRTARFLKENYAEICQRGQWRHLPAGMYWEAACKRDVYQNGAYWATPAGWFVNALALTDKELAKRSVIELVQDFRTRGICEWVNGETANLPGYVASVTLPLQGIRELR